MHDTAFAVRCTIDGMHKPAQQSIHQMVGHGHTPGRSFEATSLIEGGPMLHLWISLEAEVGVKTNSFTATASTPRGTGVPAADFVRCTRPDGNPWSPRGT